MNSFWTWWCLFFFGCNAIFNTGRLVIYKLAEVEGMQPALAMLSLTSSTAFAAWAASNLMKGKP